MSAVDLFSMPCKHVARDQTMQLGNKGIVSILREI